MDSLKVSKTNYDGYETGSTYVLVYIMISTYSGCLKKSPSLPLSVYILVIWSTQYARSHWIVTDDVVCSECSDRSLQVINYSPKSQSNTGRAIGYIDSKGTVWWTKVDVYQTHVYRAHGHGIYVKKIRSIVYSPFYPKYIIQSCPW